jgi:WD40 repeat protein
MFCNCCGTSNPDVAKFCRKCGKPIVDSPRPSVPDSKVPLSAPQVDLSNASTPVAESSPAPVAAPAPVFPSPIGIEPRKNHTSSRTVAAIAAGIAVLFIGSVAVMLLRSGRPRALDIQIGFISSIAFSPDGRQLAITGSDGTGAQLWDTDRVQWLRTLNSYSNTDWAVYSPDGHTVATWGSCPRHVVILWDAPSGKQVRVLKDDAASIGEAAFDPDGRQVLTEAFIPGTGEGGVRLWDTASGSELRRFPGFMQPVFSPDGKLLAAWNKSRSISLVDVASGNEVRRFDGHRGLLSSGIIFSPDGHLLAGTNDNAMVTVWDLASGNEIRRIYDAASMRSIAFSPDSRLLASGSEDHTIKLWDVASGNKVRTLSGHSDSVNCVAFSPDGRLLASGGADGKVFLWPLPKSR